MAGNKYFIDKKIRLGIAILIIQSSLDLSAQDINRRPPKVRCYRSAPAWGEQLNLGIAADYKHGLHQFDIKAGYLIKHTVNLGIDLKFRSNISYSGFQPGIYISYSPSPIYFSRMKLFAFGESNIHISSSILKNSTEPYASDVAVNAGLCLPFMLARYHQLAIELSAETEWVFYNSTTTCYFYPELGLNYFITIPRVRKTKEEPSE